LKFSTKSHLVQNSKTTDMDIKELFGSGEHLTALQMAVRAFIMFFITLALIRFGGMRIFGKKTAFDNILVIMLGAILARGVVGASPFFSTVAAAAVMVVIHRILAWLAINHSWVGKIVKGYRRSLYKNGEYNLRNMEITAISKDDLMEGVRLRINRNSLDSVAEVYIEKNGQLSIIEK
jgi:uncharacterized membrane protein YcaP (DUF421 family)